MRGYLPTTLDRLREQWSTGVVAGEPVVADDDSEEGEYAALMTAADLSGELLAGAGRRVVVAVELSDTEAATAASGGSIEVPRRRVAAVHTDVEERPIDADPDDDLAWFATQEVGDLLA